MKLYPRWILLKKIYHGNFFKEPFQILKVIMEKGFGMVFNNTKVATSLEVTTVTSITLVIIFQ